MNCCSSGSTKYSQRLRCGWRVLQARFWELAGITVPVGAGLCAECRLSGITTVPLALPDLDAVSRRAVVMKPGV